jgi:hypothetical protein
MLDFKMESASTLDLFNPNLCGGSVKVSGRGGSNGRTLAHTLEIAGSNPVLARHFPKLRFGAFTEPLQTAKFKTIDLVTIPKVSHLIPFRTQK